MIKIKESELRLSFIRSRGPGGQNVNKVSTAVQLKYNIVNAEIPDKIKKRFFEQYKNKISKNGDIIIVAQSYRTQNKNKIDAINRLESLFSDIILSVTTTPVYFVLFEFNTEPLTKLISRVFSEFEQERARNIVRLNIVIL